jgi:hypothetical protein
MRRRSSPPVQIASWSPIHEDNEPPLDPNLIPHTKAGIPIASYTITRPFKFGVLGPEGLLFQLRKDFSNFVKEGVMRVCSVPPPGGIHNNMTELVLYGAFVDIRGPSRRVFLYFDFCRSRVQVSGFAFRVMNFRIPRKWALFGSLDCNHWEPISRHRGLIAPSMNTFVKFQFEMTQPYRYLMLKLYRKNALLEKIDFFGILESEITDPLNEN